VFSLRSLLRPLACALAFVGLLTACGGNAFHRPAAVVNGAAISDDALQSEVPLVRVLTSLQGGSCGTAAPGEPARTACVRFALGFLVTQRVVDSFAAEQHLRVSTSEVSQAIKSAEAQDQRGQLGTTLHQFGVTMRQFEDLVRGLLLSSQVQQTIASRVVTDQQLRAEYERRKLDLTQLHVAHILVPSQQLAERIARDATPQNFGALAKQFSKDPGSAPKGGDLGTIPAGQLDSDFVRAALALRPGEISKPVHTRFGWHIIRLISVQVEPFEQARSQLLTQLSRPAFQEWLQGKLAGGDIEVNPRYGRFDPQTGQVVPLNSTGTELPSPSPSPGQPSPVPSS
jgi:parvulin-like peptidyl-prolyl isomerase